MAMRQDDVPPSFVPLLSSFGIGESTEDPAEYALGLLHDPLLKRGGFLASARHCNSAGLIHGGVLATFADYVLFVCSRGTFDAPGYAGGVTAQLNLNFVGNVPAGRWVEGEGEVVANTSSLVFVRGKIFTFEFAVGQFPVHGEKRRRKTLATFDGIIKKLRPRKKITKTVDGRSNL